VPLTVASYNFLSGGSHKRTGHWSRLMRDLKADLVCAQECRPPQDCPGERYRLSEDDGWIWAPARSARWGSAVLSRSIRIHSILVPRYAGWIVGGELSGESGVDGRPTRVFSIHCPVGERGYVRTMHEILDLLAPLRAGAELILAGDCNVATGYRHPAEARTISRGERELLDRMSNELQLVSCWQAANPGRPLAQTLRWTTNPTTPYHCDGIFVTPFWLERLVSCRVVAGSRWSQLSDHNPVIATFSELNTPAPFPSLVAERHHRIHARRP
jgi:endonuclease/exonuclease/phosphatase family metal-dependent hydrolase